MIFVWGSVVFLRVFIVGCCCCCCCCYYYCCCCCCCCCCRRRRRRRYCCWWWCFLSQPPVQCIPGLFPGGKAVGALRCPPTPTSTEVTERAKLQLYRPLPPGLSWSVLGQPLPLPIRNTKLFLALLLHLVYCNLFFQSLIIYFMFMVLCIIIYSMK